MGNKIRKLGKAETNRRALTIAAVYRLKDLLVLRRNARKIYKQAIYAVKHRGNTSGV